MSTRLAMCAQPTRSVLLVEDDAGIRAALLARFTRAGWHVSAAASAREAEYRLAQDAFDLLVSDVRLPDGSGRDLLKLAQEAESRIPVVLMTAYGTVPEAVEAIRAGASDYLIKPVAWEQLSGIAERLLGGESAPEQPQARREEPRTRGAQGQAKGIVGKAPVLLQALARARAAASTDADVLVEAESGTGKELLARFIHDASSRAAKPFVAVNCAAVPEHLLESELFGHARGAFTGAVQARAGKFELAHGGTLLLDEIGEMPLHLQPKLLRALQEREFERLGDTRTVRVDIRVVATTNVMLARAVERGTFRSDLYYRLNVIPLSLPPLRERAGDIALLARYFAEKWTERTGRPAPRLGEDFLEMLSLQPWSGNVRELAHFMERMLSLHASGEGASSLDRAAFLRETGSALARVASGAIVNQAAAAPEMRAAPADSLAGVPIRQLERMHLEKTLALTQGNRTHAAEMLGISLRTMRNKIREYGLPPRRYA